MASIPVFSPFTPMKQKHKPLSFQPLLRTRSSFSLQRVSKGCSISSFACSTSKLHGGRVGFNHREGKTSFLKFGVDESVVGGGGNGDVGERDWSQILSALLPFVVAVTAVAALSQPSTFTWVSKELYAPALGGIMLSIGIGLSMEDFALAFKRPLPLSIGFIAQYVLKPVLGVLIAKAFGLPRMFYAGFVLTACVSGAQLSSYASFISKGDVALCIVLTSYTTIASVIVTPLLTGLLIGSVVPVDAVAMSKSILQVVLAPVTLGLLLNTYAKPVVSILRPVMPFVAMICTSLCIGSPLAINRSQILSGEGLRLVAPVLIFHAAAFTLGYWFSNLPSLRQEEQVSRTISLCTGMQSSTLAGLLATQFLGSSQAVPPACSVVAMAIMGLCLASFWGKGFEIKNLLSSLPSLRTNSAFEA
ncbi:putative Bile acid:sodium symporter/arsenical resistance protein Acr3 [Medicago truncatula]|uniref:Na+-bile acid cotransporter n=1 Tax=Medicago truncatula TaxID=3880 RepID=G7KZ42_MEDTR|nr:probable sodium/metabolite cotransporter BASS3, chloroplastic [Medicago truncatula]AES79046.1 Na+-bile acid cotransporter [Medicago truncatula]RHN45735.1 putative Bile acid:sodium symporter/arsenical resistance protein Acr3 [Medicago truncatula]